MSRDYRILSSTDMKKTVIIANSYKTFDFYRKIWYISFATHFNI